MLTKARKWSVSDHQEQQQNPGQVNGRKFCSHSPKVMNAVDSLHYFSQLLTKFKDKKKDSVIKQNTERKKEKKRK